jgi:GNAT superfamily N-acetyltransferase
MAKWSIVPLAKEHDRSAFDCGKPTLNEFLTTLAGQYERRGTGRTFVLTPAGSCQVVGYYTLAAGSLDFGRLPAKVAKKLPRHPVPIILLGRLAIDHRSQGQGLGADLLVDASIRAVMTAEDLGVFALGVEAIDEDAVRFYMRFGFSPLTDDPRYLFLPIETLRKQFGGSSR